MQKRRMIFVIGLITLILFSVFVIVYSVYLSKEKVNVEWRNSSIQDVTRVFKTGDTLDQPFRAGSDFIGVSLMFNYSLKDQEPSGSGLLIISVLSQDGETLASADWPLEDSDRNVASNILFDHPVRVSEPSDFLLRIEARQVSADSRIYVTVGTPDDATKPLSWNGSEQAVGLYLGLDTPVSYKYVRAGILFALLSFLAGVIFLYVLLMRHWKLLWLYVLAASILGGMLLWVQTPMYGFDVVFHTDTAYELSNVILGKAPFSDMFQGDSLRTIPRRVCDVYETLPRYSTTNILNNYNGLMDKLTIRQTKAEQALEEHETADIGTPFYLYLPSALGFSLARVLQLNLYWLLLLGRLFLLAVCITIGARAIRNAPFAQSMFFVLGLLPAVLMQQVSISRDALIFTLVVYYVSLCLRLAYSNARINFWGMARVFLTASLIAPCKLVYLPLSLFWLIIPFKRMVRTRRRDALILSVIGAVIVLVPFLYFNLMSISRLASGSQARSLVGTAAYTLSEILTNPGRLLILLMNTLRNGIGDIYLNAISLFEIQAGLSNGVALGFSALLFLSALSNPGESPELARVTWPDKLWMLLVLLLGSVLLAFAAISWTPRIQVVIRGLQGRYFTPFFPLLFLLVRNNRLIQKKRNCDSQIICGSYALGWLTMFNMYVWTISK